MMLRLRTRMKNLRKKRKNTLRSSKIRSTRKKKSRLRILMKRMMRGTRLMKKIGDSRKKRKS
jgi:hypothetical protein